MPSLFLDKHFKINIHISFACVFVEHKLLFLAFPTAFHKVIFGQVLE